MEVLPSVLGLSEGDASSRASPDAAIMSDYPPYGRPIRAAAARLIARGTQDEASRHGWRMTVVVVEPTGDIVLIEKGDDAQYGSTHIALNKARAAAIYRRKTGVYVEPESDLVLNRSSTAATVALDGGLPIVCSGKLIGAIGVSGESPEQDSWAALAGLACFKQAQG
jgi:glc operon protein GlcG